MARYLSPEWVQAFDAALGALDLTDVVAAAGEGSLAAADGVFSVAQLVHGVPAELGLGSEVRVVLSVSGGRAHLALHDDGATGTQSTGTEATGTEATGTEATGTEATGTEATGTEATATIALGYADALALALGRLDPADALSQGRVRVRGDLAALVAGEEVLAAAASRLGPTLSDLTDPMELIEPTAGTDPSPVAGSDPETG